MQPASKNERECGAAGEIRPRIRQKGAADLIERLIRPRIRQKGAADLIERVITAADQAERCGRPH